MNETIFVGINNRITLPLARPDVFHTSCFAFVYFPDIQDSYLPSMLCKFIFHKFDASVSAIV